MPIIDITLVEGRSLDEKEKMFAAMTDAVVMTLHCRPDQVRIKVNEVAAIDYAIGGKSWQRIEADKG